MEQAVRDGLIDRNPARITGWQREDARAEDNLVWSPARRSPGVAVRPIGGRCRPAGARRPDGDLRLRPPGEHTRQ